MPNYDYSALLGRAKGRRVDPNTKLASLNESDTRSDYPESLRYVLVSMSAVEGRSTEIYNEEADRVEFQLRKMPNYSLDFARQGSVPLNIHIRTVSDIDLLCINLSFYHGPSMSGTSVHNYTPDTKATQRKLRSDSVQRLKDAYWGATIDDTSSGKAIKMSGGSLRRCVDVVIARWLNTPLYVTTKRREDRAINAYDADIHDLIPNHPFLHMERVHARDAKFMGGHKRYVRLLKCIKEDVAIEGLSSYDITSTIYHCVDLRLCETHSILDNLKYLERYLFDLTQNDAKRESLTVPNETRMIFEGNPKRKAALIQLWAVIYRIIEDLNSISIRRYISGGTMVDI
jgi:hypothetical protein